MNKNVFLLLLGTALIPAGCNMAPKYDRPAAPVRTVWPSGDAYRDSQTASNAPQATDLTWREFFGDQKLTKLIETALSNNRDLRLAALNVERARALYGIQKAELLPTLNANANAGKEHQADVYGFGRSLTLETYRVNLGVYAWELDFFGRLRNFKDRALEEYLATEQARRGAQILLISSVANAYLTLAADREELALAQTTLTSQQDAIT
jgi:multidrug efflux system outer membrane protein